MSGNGVPVPEKEGVIIVNVLANSPAEECGLKTLDVLLEIDHKYVYYH